MLTKKINLKEKYSKIDKHWSAAASGRHGARARILEPALQGWGRPWVVCDPAVRYIQRI